MFLSSSWEAEIQTASIIDKPAAQHYKWNLTRLQHMLKMCHYTCIPSSSIKKFTFNCWRSFSFFFLKQSKLQVILKNIQAILPDISSMSTQHYNSFPLTKYVIHYDFSMYSILNIMNCTLWDLFFWLLIISQNQTCHIFLFCAYWNIWNTVSTLDGVADKSTG
jgi:hypothetical protein